MSAPLRESGRVNRRRVVKLPAPVGGLNLRDSMDAMAQTDAIVCDNWIPRENYCELRKGCVKAAELPPASTLAAYRCGGREELLAAAQGKIYRVNFTSAPAVLADGFASDRWQCVQYKERLFLANGADPVQVYDGQTLQPAGFTFGETAGEPPSLCTVTLYNNRLFFIQDGTLKVYYTENAGAVSGPLKELDFAQFCRLGGALCAAFDWTQDGGEGTDDQLVFLTTEGEALVYSGINPADAGTWALKGIYRIARPVGRRCVEKLGGDAVVLTRDGYFLLSRLLSALAANRAMAFSDKINAGIKALKNRFSAEGWALTYYDAGTLLIGNLPPVSSRLEATQFVMNTATGAWCRFTNLPARCFETLGDRLYFAHQDGGIWQALEGRRDGTDAIPGQLQQAFSDFGGAYVKNFKEIEIIVSTNLDLEFALLFGVDFKTQRENYVSTFADDASRWDVAKWDEGLWDADESIKRRRVPVFCEPGTRGSVGIRTNTKAGDVKFYSWQVSFEAGQGMA